MAVRTIQVLLVEDSPTDALIIQEELTSVLDYAYAVRHVERLEHALECLGEQQFDVVLLDLGLPDSTGLDTFARLQGADSQVPIVIVSDNRERAMAFKAVQAGALEYVIKEQLEGNLLPRVIRYAMERKRNVEALRATHVQLRLLLDHSPAALIAWKVEGDELVPHLVSENIISLLGFTVPEAMQPGWWFAQLHPHDREEAIGSIAVTMEHGESHTEYRLRHKDGTYRWVDDNRRLVLDDSGRPVQQVGTWTDITERKQKTELLRLRESALRQVSQGVLIGDENRRIIYANPSFTAITGYAEHEILGKSCAILQGPGSNPQTIQEIREALNNLQPFEGEILNYRKNGSAFWNELSITPFTTDNGSTRFIGIQRDVTVRKLDQEELRHREQNSRHEHALLRALVDCIPDLIAFKDTEARYLGCNKAFENFTGTSEDSLLGQKAAFNPGEHDLLVSGNPVRLEEWISPQMRSRGSSRRCAPRTMGQAESSWASSASAATLPTAKRRSRSLR